MTIAAPAQTFTTLVNFNGTNGAFPQGTFIQGVDGNYYGAAPGADSCTSKCGVVFKLTRGGTLKTIYTFCLQDGCPDGSAPRWALVLGIDGDLYGPTLDHTSPGEIFKLAPGGDLTVLDRFRTTPSRVMQARDGDFYGTTPNDGSYGGGTIFKLTSSGQKTVLYNFGNGGSDSPQGGLMQANDGNFYGTTVFGGPGNYGTVYKLTPGGNFIILHTFDGTDGGFPGAGLVQGTDGNLYGTTEDTVFRITLEGVLTTLHTFGFDEGNSPEAALIQATDGNFYGTTYTGSSYADLGTVFVVTPTGILTTLHRFGEVDGDSPVAGLLQGTDGKFYGTTYLGGPYDAGTIFSLDMGLGPFVAFVRNPAKVGQAFGILGQGFNGTTSVTLNGAPISFRVMSNTLIEATIPSGATTGYVTGTSPHGTLTSNVPFRVLPQVLSFSPPSGPVGTVVTITGISLTQANGVGFGDDIGARFTVNSDTQVTATVPNGAKTGPVGIRTLGGIGISPTIFTVTP
jgi:uncharacterized repeat protein (TIGR03803 family)